MNYPEYYEGITTPVLFDLDPEDSTRCDCAGCGVDFHLDDLEERLVNIPTLIDKKTVFTLQTTLVCVECGDYYQPQITD